MLWLVELETASPDDGIQMKEMFEDSLRLLGDDIATATVDVDGWIMRFEIDARDPEEALSFAMIRILAVADLAYLPQWPVVAIQVLDAEYASAACRRIEAS